MSLASEERKKVILSLLHGSGKVIASELAQRFEVSTETIRRDLDELEKESKLKKVYGGAILFKANTEPALLERETIHVEAKRQIGALAAELVEDNDVIALDEGTTILQIIPHLLAKQHLTVLTNSIPALIALLEHKKRGDFNGKIIVIGGEVDAKHLRVSGSIAERALEEFFVNKAFISVDGVSLKNGLTSYDYDKAVFTRKMIACSDTAIVVADSSKIPRRTVVKIAGLQDIHVLISDAPPKAEWTEGLEKLAVRWIYPAGERQ